MGLFDAAPDPNTPIAPQQPLSPLDLGLPAGLATGPTLTAPAPVPVPGPVGQDPRQKLVLLAALAAAIAGGRRSGLGGLPGGVLAGQQNIREDQQQVYQRAQAEHDKQQAAYEVNQRAEQMRQESRQKTVSAALDHVATQVATFDNKEEYDRFINAAGNTLVSSGFKSLTPNALRAQYPFQAPTQEKSATKAWGKWIGNESNKRLLEENPEQALKSVVAVDLNGDGIIEHVPLTKLAEAAGQGFAQDEQGKPLVLPKGVAGTSAFDVAYRNQIEQFRIENKREPTPTEKNKLIQAAHALGTDPEMADLRRESLATRNAILKLQQGLIPTPEDAAAVADDVVNKRLAPSQIAVIAAGRGQYGGMFRTLIQRAMKQADPTFNWEEAESTYQLAKSPAFQNTIRYMDAAVESLPRLLSSAQTLANGKVRSVTQLINMGQSQFNNVDLKRYNTDRVLVADEIAKIIQGGGTGSGTSDAKLRQAGDLLQQSDSPAAIATALKEVQFLIGNRRKALTRGTPFETAPQGEPIQQPIPGIRGGMAESRDGGKTWTRVK